MNTADNNVQPLSSVMPSHLDFPVVGIEASAGGIQALLSFFQHMPENPGMAFVVVLHLSPEHVKPGHSDFPEGHRTAGTAGRPHGTGRSQSYRCHCPNRQLLMNDGCLTIEDLPRPTALSACRQ